MTDPPLYRQVRDELLAADVPPQPGVLDAQSLAYREMGAHDVVLDDEIEAHAARRHLPMPPAVHIADVILLPEDYEREYWDAGREDPRP
ncbi:hypothetical protein ACL02T_32875 [Pseudonocardia sp. RS010]|uniref:hypothetical protein n=1 Tax=Pseudonocardia sp. RS010 TaxID=3385979 RepID=UPI0039A2B41C